MIEKGQNFSGLNHKHLKTLTRSPGRNKSMQFELNKSLSKVMSRSPTKKNPLDIHDITKFVTKDIKKISDLDDPTFEQ